MELMSSQKLTNCCVAAIALVTAAYLSTPHSSTIARLAFGAFCLAIPSYCFLAKASILMASQKTALRRYGVFSGSRHTRCMPSSLKNHQALQDEIFVWPTCEFSLQHQF